MDKDALTLRTTILYFELHGNDMRARLLGRNAMNKN